MSTLPLRAPAASHGVSIPAFARIGAFFKLLAEAYADAQLSMREAQKKYPYAGV